jgi:glycosyltransferase involved in cell wall biosynthesis
MKICIDARKISDSGIGTYLQNLLRRFHAMDNTNEYFLLFPPSEIENFDYTNPKFHKRINRSPKYSVWEHLSIPLALHSVNADIFHSPHYVTPWIKTKPTVVTIHDLIHLRFPQFLPSRAAYWYARAVLARSVHTADIVITVSEGSKRDLLELLKVQEKKIRVIYNGVDETFRKAAPECFILLEQQFGLREGYMLYVGNFKAHKNLLRLLHAFAQINSNLCPYLVLAGESLEKYKRLRDAIQDLGLAQRVLAVGKVTSEQLNLLYSFAALLVFPSLYEGFGLPPLEAMRCEVPVVASNSSCLPEILGDAALYFDPYSVDDMTDKLNLVLQEAGLRRELISKGKERSHFFPWEAAAQKTLRAYEELG